MRGERDTPGKLFITGIPNDYDEKELELAFAKFGRIIDALVVKDKATGKSKGFGFLTFEVPVDADDALKGMNGVELGGQKIRVEHAVAKQPRDRDGGGFRGGRGGFRGRGGRGGDSRGRDGGRPYDSRGRGGSRGMYDSGMRDSRGPPRDSRGPMRDSRDSRGPRGFDEGRPSERSGGFGSYRDRSPVRDYDRDYQNGSRSGAYAGSSGARGYESSSRDFGQSSGSRDYGDSGRAYDSYSTSRGYDNGASSYKAGQRSTQPRW